MSQSRSTKPSYYSDVTSHSATQAERRKEPTDAKEAEEQLELEAKNKLAAKLRATLIGQSLGGLFMTKAQLKEAGITIVHMSPKSSKTQHSSHGASASTNAVARGGRSRRMRHRKHRATHHRVRRRRNITRRRNRY